MKKTTTSKTNERQPHRIRLPGFITEKEVGLGDVIKRATSAVGIRPCGGSKAVLRRSTSGLFLPDGTQSNAANGNQIK